MTMRITVSGAWMAACGLGSTDTTFDVLDVVPTAAAIGSGFEVMFIVNRNGQPWHVAKGRLAPAKPAPVQAAAPQTGRRTRKPRPYHMLLVTQDGKWTPQ